MEKFTLITPEGHYISGTIYLPKGNYKSVVVIASATGVKQRYYSKFAQFLSEQGAIVYTFDYAGIGASKLESLKKFNTTAFSWGSNDLESIISHATARFTNFPITIIGHSIGGQLIGLAPSAIQADKIVLVAAQSGYWKLWKGFEKIRMFANWHIVFPLFIRIFGYFPGKKLGIMEDLPKDVALEWRKWCSSLNYLFDHIPNEKHYFSDIEAEISAFSTADDRYAPKSAVDWLTSKYDNGSIAKHHLIPKDLGLAKIGHFGFFKSQNSNIIWKTLSDEVATIQQPV